MKAIFESTVLRMPRSMILNARVFSAKYMTLVIGNYLTLVSMRSVFYKPDDFSITIGY